ncbi:MAG: hypothetical protein EBX50_16355 [Chitinophagia bacterium]|nr:hypothetical protein [Chitinophagia bacterium]
MKKENRWLFIYFISNKVSLDMKKTFLIFKMLCVLLCFGRTYAQTNSCPTVKDADGHIYASQKVGKLCWFTTNLKTSKYANGTPIRKIDDRSRWQNDKTGAYACPTGWRVPTDPDWNSLISHFDKNAKNGQEAIQSTTCGDYLKDSLLWITQDKANNRSGLRVLPAGWRNSDGTFLLTGYNAVFWTSGSSEGYGICRKLTFQNSTVQRLKRNPSDGYSVRCVKDIGF